MEERAAISPGLPRPNPTVSYWQDPPSDLAKHRTTQELPNTIDALIIGSGITGSSLAYNILNGPHPPSVLMLEARTACSGATGRNGGHTKCASYREFLDNVRDLGEGEAAKIVRFQYNTMRAVHDFAREHGIECDSWQGDTVDVFYDRGQWAKATKAVAEIKRVLGESDPASRYTFHDATKTEQMLLAQGSLGSLQYESGSLSAYKFTIGVLGLALGKGLNLQMETPALKVTKDEAKGWIVQTSRGNIRAKKVLLATNGYTAHLYPALQGVIVPLRGHMTGQRPGSGLPKEGLGVTYSFIYGNGYEYMISRPPGSKFAGDIMIGGGATKAPDEGLLEWGEANDAVIDDFILKYVVSCTGTYFGSNWGEDNPEGRLRKAWTGVMGYSADGFPLVGQIPGEDGLYIAASFQGNGMVLCFQVARALVAIMNQEHEDELDHWFPKAFRMTSDRTRHKFQGKRHSKVSPMDLGIKSQG